MSRVKNRKIPFLRKFVPRAGLEPARRGEPPTDFKSVASADSATPAQASPDSVWTVCLAASGGKANGPGEAWSGRRDLNPRPSAWQADALPLSYARASVFIVSRVRWLVKSSRSRAARLRAPQTESDSPSPVRAAAGPAGSPRSPRRTPLTLS